MPDESRNDVTRILHAVERGEARALDELLPLVYDELRLLASQKLSHESPGQTLQATDWSEAYSVLWVRTAMPGQAVPTFSARRQKLCVASWLNTLERREARNVVEIVSALSS
jgi:hypothetical protein